MKVARFRTADSTERCGRVHDDRIVEFDRLDYSDWLRSRSEPATGREWPVADVQLLPPIARDAKVCCVGYNYASHGSEMSRELPEHPTLFARHPDSLVGSGDPVLRPAESIEFDWEGEVGVVIGTAGRRIRREDVLDHIAGYTVVADNSIRDWQFHSTQATAGKNWPASGSCGPWLVTADEVGDKPLALKTELNGELKQRASTAELHFDVPALVAYISTFTMLRPGDLIATGTPSGIGYREVPPRFLRPGDRLRVSVDLVGDLVNDVADEVRAASTARTAR